jgi:hypothetical protein
MEFLFHLFLIDFHLTEKYSPSFRVRRFKERIRVKDRLVSKALKASKIILIGDAEEMIKISSVILGKSRFDKL